MTHFSKILSMCDKPIDVQLEQRPKKYMFGLKHYGEIPKTINKADGDPWDVAVPGYNSLPIGKKLKMKKLIGVLLLANGNHKLFIDVFTNQKRNHMQAKKEIDTYQKKYCKYTKIPGKYIDLIV